MNAAIIDDEQLYRLDLSYVEALGELSEAEVHTLMAKVPK